MPGSRPLLALLCAAAAATPPAAAHAAAPWAHSWDTAGAAWWGDFGYSLLTEPQAEFIANNYFLASLEKCTGRGQGLPTEQGIYQTARQLKKINPKVKTTFYWHTGQAGIGCYSNNATFMEHPEWFLRVSVIYQHPLTTSSFFSLEPDSRSLSDWISDAGRPRQRRRAQGRQTPNLQPAD